MTTEPAAIEIAAAHHRAGRLDLAIPIYRRIVASNPSHAEAHKMLAIALFQSGATAEAEQAARRALALKPTSPDAANILAAILGRTGRYGEAVRVLLPLGERLRTFPGICLNLGLAYRGLRDFANAASWLRHAIDGDPRLPGAHENLGMVLTEIGARADAAQAFRAALALDANNANARHMLAALEGTTPDAPPADYVRALFDDYAPRFERELVSHLDYRVPDILRGLIDRLGRRNFVRALDLGCGTGLSGAALNDIAGAEIVGVDLAPAMIAEAKNKNVYSALFAMEIAAYLGSNDAKRKPFDLVVAADVFIYVGKLDAVFAALAERVAPAGLFAFSVEGCIEADFVLRGSGRYAHNVAYIEHLARLHGFAIRAQEAIAIRKASDGTVDGFAWVLERTV
jgi:predicted TPR repeat methyltransferase